MRVLHVSTGKNWGGGEQQVLYLLTFLTKEEHVLFCPKKSPLGEKARTTRARILTHRPLPHLVRMIYLPFRVWYITRTYRIQIIHAHDSHAHTMVWLASVLPGNKAPIIVSRRVTLGQHRGILSTRKYNSPHIANFICISEAVRTSLKGIVKQPDKLKLVYSGTDPLRFTLRSPVSFLREELGWPLGVKIIGKIASLVPAKDYPTFLKTAALLLEKRDDLRFVIVGEGPEKARLKALATELHISHRVVFAGFRSDIEKVLPSIDVMLFTSKSEGLGTILLDAMVCGVPVIATRIDGITEIVQHEINGLLASPGDALGLAGAVLRLLEDEEFRTQIIQSASLRVRDFDARNMATQTLRIYAETLNINPSMGNRG